MVANISRLDGTDQAWYADRPAWHGLGTVSKGAKTAEQVERSVPAFRKPVILVPVAAKIGGKWVEQDDTFATVRTGTQVAMGYVTKSYEELTDGDALRLLEAVITEIGDKARAGFVTAGLLGAKGQRGFASIDLTRVFGAALKVKRDPSRQESHIFGDWTHDGTGAMHIGAWNNRVECNNMLDMANEYGQRHGLIARIRHAGDIKAQVEEAQRVLGLVELTAQKHVALMNALQDQPVDLKWMRGFVPLVVRPEEAYKDLGKRTLKNRAEAENNIVDLFKHSKTLVGVPNSAYRAYQSIAEYADHFRPLRIGPETPLAVAADRRFRSITEGPAADLKARGLELIRQEFEISIPA